MLTEFLHVGFGNVLSVNRVVAVASPGSAPIKRMVQRAKERGDCVDMTSGRRTKAVVFADSGHIILAAITPETIAGRLTAARKGLGMQASDEESSP